MGGLWDQLDRGGTCETVIHKYDDDTDMIFVVQGRYKVVQGGKMVQREPRREHTTVGRRSVVGRSARPSREVEVLMDLSDRRSLQRGELSRLYINHPSNENYSILTLPIRICFGDLLAKYGIRVKESQDRPAQHLSPRCTDARV